MKLKELKKDFGYFLMSYPRSGSNWFRYCSEFLTKKPSIGPNHNQTVLNSPFGSRLEMGVDLSRDYILYRAHELEEGVEGKPLIILIRNYKECILRHTHRGSSGATLSQIKEVFSREKLMYLNVLRFYEKSKENKFIVYYEDLIKYPESTLRGVLEFFGENGNYLKDFINNYDRHRATSYNQYTTLLEKSETQGDPNKLKYHSNFLSGDILLQIDQLFKEEKVLFDKYLLRYEERAF